MANKFMVKVTMYGKVFKWKNIPKRTPCSLQLLDEKEKDTCVKLLKSFYRIPERFIKVIDLESVAAAKANKKPHEEPKKDVTERAKEMVESKAAKVEVTPEEVIVTPAPVVEEVVKIEASPELVEIMEDAVKAEPIIDVIEEPVEVESKKKKKKKKKK